MSVVGGENKENMGGASNTNKKRMIGDYILGRDLATP